MIYAMLQPVVVLVGWTLVMWGWMLATRMPALRQAGIELGKLTGGRGSDAERVLPAKTMWPAHNYNHLFEQPTAFYAVAIVLALVDPGRGWGLWFAWGYVGLRIAHSVVQATFNRVAVRFALFVASTLCLVAMTIRAAIIVSG